MTYKALWLFVWKFIGRQKWAFFTLFSVSLVWSLDATLWPVILQQLIDIFTRYDLDRSTAWPMVQQIIFYGLCLWLLVEAGFRCQGYLLARTLPRLEADIRMEMFDHIQRHSPKYFNEHFSGSLANKITDMTTQVSLILHEIINTFIPAVATCVLGIVLFAQLNFLFACLLAAWLLIHFAICILFVKRCDKYENLHGEVRSNLLGRIVDSFTNNFAVNLFYRFKEERAYLAPFQKEEQERNRDAKKCVERMRLYLGLVTLFGAGFAIYGAMLYSWMQGQLTAGEVAQIFNTTWNIQQIIWIVGFALPVVFQSIGIAKQALSVMNIPQDIADAPHAKPLIVTKGEIVFENVSFQYGKKKLFQNKDVQIYGGERVGLVGYSGAGKSTFVNLILRFFPVETGRILIDGQEISQLTLESLRRQIALIPQDPVLFHRTLYDNILFGRPDASDKEVFEAARLAHCEEFIAKLPQSYNSVVGERGTKLSGGERQRIAIARAILANAPILILDEATSALDSMTEKYIQESLQWLMRNRTTIVIAHRLSTLIGMERILMFKDGKIIEQGSHSDLMILGGLYSRLWSMQAGGFLPKKNVSQIEIKKQSQVQESLSG